MTTPSAPAPTPVRSVRCPTCGGASVYASTNPYRPFCSERCKNADFGAWASEAYRVEASPPVEDDGDSGPAHQA
ncbi:MAG: DNA gyrase inhibitor YacG [Burkholderiales bacterium]